MLLCKTAVAVLFTSISFKDIPSDSGWKLQGQRVIWFFFSTDKLNVHSFISSLQTWSHSLHYELKLMHATLTTCILMRYEIRQSILNLNYTRDKDTFAKLDYWWPRSCHSLTLKFRKTCTPTKENPRVSDLWVFMLRELKHSSSIFLQMDLCTQCFQCVKYYLILANLYRHFI